MAVKEHRVYAAVDTQMLNELTKRAQECDRTVSYLVRLGIQHVLNELDPEKQVKEGVASHPASRATLGLVKI